MLKAIIFDMDDVILSSKPYDYPAWKHIFDEFNQPFNSNIHKSLLGMKNAEIIKKFIPNAKIEDIPEIEKRKELYFVDLVIKNKAQITPGLCELIDDIKKKIKLAVATGGPMIKVKGIFDFLKLDQYFSVVVTADDVSRGKPNPELFLTAAKKLNISPKNCLVVEDADNGVKAAKAAGMKCLAITTTHKRDELKNADLIIDSFNEINLKILEKLFK